MKKEELDKILESHKLWLDGEGGERADLCDADLRNADLLGADLRYAYLRDADLRDANLCNADLRGAYFQCADLRDADLHYANLCDADLRYAYFQGADLRDANLCGAILNGAYLLGAKNVPFVPLACPSDGAFTAWKKVKDVFLVELLIPADARRCSATTTKCRCDKAMVASVTDTLRDKQVKEVTNYREGKSTVYRVGEMVYPDSYDEDRWNECSNGIHFFVNKQEAIDY